MRTACGLGKEPRVVCKVECAGQEATLLKDGSDVAVRAGVASVDVDGGGGTSGRRWKRASGLVDQTGNVDAVVLEGVVGIGSVIPLDMCELTEI